MSRTIYGEARGTGAAGMRHVAAVILNRADNPRWWGRDIISVCLAPYQFSCRNRDDPNYPKLMAVTEDDLEFRIAVGIATAAIGRKLFDETGGADSYFALSMKRPPAWAPRAHKTLADGWHQFCRVELPAPSGEPEAPCVSVHTPAETAAPELTADELDNLYNPGA
jgi:hypothetical protein